MRLTKAGEYAVRCALYLSSRPLQEIVSSREIARVMDIPNQFLGKIAQQLARAHIIEIIQGPKGGYRLLISPERLTLLDVVEAVTGEIFLNDCLLRPESCRRSPDCFVHQVWHKARNQLRETLNQANFAMLLAENSCKINFLSKQAEDLKSTGS